MEEMHHDSYAKRSMGSQSSHDVLCDNQKWSISHWLKRRSEEARAGGGVATFICPARCVPIFHLLGM